MAAGTPGALAPGAIGKPLTWLRPYRARVAAALLVLVFVGTSELGIVLALRNIIDSGFGSPDLRLSDTFFPLAAMVLVYAASSYFWISSVSWLGERVAADIRRDVFGHVVGLGAGFFESTRTGDIQSRLVNDASLVQSLIVLTVPNGLRSLILLVGSGVLLSVSSAKLAAIVLAMLPILVLPAMFLSRRVRRLSRGSQEEIARVNLIAGESLEAIETVQAFTHEDLDRKRVAGAAEQAFVAARRRFRAEALLSSLVSLLVFGLVAGVLWVGATDVEADRMTAGELTAFVIYAVIAATSLAGLSSVLTQVQRAAGAAERLIELSAARDEIQVREPRRDLPEAWSGAVEFVDVTYTYPSRPESPALNGFSLSVASGETVALVGPSGAGKSTVFRLLLRFCDPQSGTVSLDGVDLTNVDPHQVRARLGIVTQSPAVFTTTVMENIRYGRPEATDEEVYEAAETAAAHEFIEALPRGYRTELGERGAGLSGGQRQRLAIARAVLRSDRGMLLLDEATSSLDSSSERQVQQALERVTRARTCLIIAHRLPTVMMADRIVVMNRGRVVGSGTHWDLMKQDGLYAGLARLQFHSPGRERMAGTGSGHDHPEWEFDD